MFKSQDDEITGCVGTIVLLILSLIIGAVANGWALSILWRWFIVTVFEVPPLSLVQAIGFAMVISFLTSNLQSEQYKSGDFTELIGQFVGRSILYPILIVAIGWVVSGLL